MTPMPLSEPLQAFDIVVVPFPFSDRMAEKRRPALVISRNEQHVAHGHVWLAMITSAQQESWTTDITIKDLETAGLPKASVVRTAKISTTEVSRILRKIGSLDLETAQAVRGQIIAQLG
jgi:mRNA interferase MazF